MGNQAGLRWIQINLEGHQGIRPRSSHTARTCKMSKTFQAVCGDDMAWVEESSSKEEQEQEGRAGLGLEGRGGVRIVSCM